MKKFPIILSLLLASAGLAQESIPAGVIVGEPICGFQAKHFYLDADKANKGLSVEMFVGDVRLDQPTTMRFFVNLKPGDFPVDDLQVEHEKLIHIIGVRDDLKEFFHIHPLKISPGMWAVDYVFTNGGTYKIWSDIKYRMTSYSFAHPKLTVPGAAGEMKIDPVENDRATCGGYELDFKHSDPLSATKTNRLEFSIRDGAGNLVSTENFLGAAMHLVVVKDDLSVFLHGHPDNHGPIATNVVFSQLFPQAGTYKMFAQFRPGTANLPHDASLLAEFFVKVKD